MTLKRIRLELARDPEFPDGSAHHGYEFVAPITGDGRINPEEWKRHRNLCRVRRFWAGAEDETGQVTRKPGGNWAFHYEAHGQESDDDTGYRFGDHRFVPGEYVSIREHDDDRLRTFRIVSVRNVT